MNRRAQPASRLRLWISAFGILALLSVSAITQAAESDRQFKRLTGTLKEPVPYGQRDVTVVLQLAGDPVAVARSQSPDKALLTTEQGAIERNLRTQQDAIAPTVTRQGGRVLATYQYAINGIKVQGTPAQIADWAKLPGVIGVKLVRTYSRANTQSVPYIGTAAAWSGPAGLHGEHIRIAIIDSGIDYTHADFGGPGTVAAYKEAFATSTQPADPRWFGPDAPKVKGGVDLVGDRYTGSHGSAPEPDPNPLDCEGHGSHVAGTAAGFGVTADGKTFRGPYDTKTPQRTFIVGPGVAPLADLYAIRVFGCEGTTGVLIDAIEWAVAHDVQVINMSLGSPFGTAADAESVAAENAVNAGIVVIAGSGNDGTSVPYMTRNPAVANHVIDVGAVDSRRTYPGVRLDLSTGRSVVALVANDVPLSKGKALPTVVLRTASGAVSLGCDPNEYANVTGKLVITARGVCARVARAIFGQQAGAAAVAIINNAPGYTDFEYTITENPDTHERYAVTIPFFAIQGATSTSDDGAALVAAGDAQGTATFGVAVGLPNPTGGQVESFSSAGPRAGDGHLKPDIVAPGRDISSTEVGTGNLPTLYFGTSMASPHVAGAAALAIQAHPRWRAADVATAIVNTADADQVVDYMPQLAGSGLVQPAAATRTTVIARSASGEPNLSFGVEEFTSDLRSTRSVWLQNRGVFPALFAVSVEDSSGSPHKATVDQRFVALGGRDSRALELKLSVPASTVGDSSAFRQVQGRVVLTPLIGSNNGTKLTIPYYMVARARSDIRAGMTGNPSGGSGVVSLENRSNAVDGTASVFTWGMRGTHAELGSAGIRSVGVQSLDAPSGDRYLVFALNTFERTSTHSTRYYDLYLDVDGDDVADYLIEAADLGALLGKDPTGQMVTAVFDLVRGGGVLEFEATAANDSATILMPVLASTVGLTSANPRFTYVAQLTDARLLKFDSITTPASFNAFHSAISNGSFVTVPKGQRTSVPVVVDSTELALTPALGTMIVATENSSERDRQALLLPLTP